MNGHVGVLPHLLFLHNFHVAPDLESIIFGSSGHCNSIKCWLLLIFLCFGQVCGFLESCPYELTMLHYSSCEDLSTLFGE
jgi:hypothetical protein